MASKKNNLNVFLSNLAVMNIKIHNLHWNVTGREFLLLHKMTEKMYTMLQLQFDEVAEAIKMQNELPLARMTDYLENATIEEIDSRDYTADEVLQILDADCQNMIKLAKSIRDEADEKDNFLVANMLEEYIACYTKKSWMIRAMLQNDAIIAEDDE